MSSKVDRRKGLDEDFSSELLLRDIEEISKALYLPPKSFNSSYDYGPSAAAIPSNFSIPSSSNKDKISLLSRKDKKSSIWNWKPLKALTHSHHHRISCCFYLNVHAIEGLPSNFNGLNLCVTWKQKGELLRTRLTPVSAGMVEFEGTLVHQCTVYANRTGAQNLAKYEAKLFLLQTYAIDPRGQAFDIGKHWIDLTRLLPLTLEELGRDKRSSGKWTTSFKLSGKAEGAVLNVSFGFYVLDGKSFDPGYFVKIPDVVDWGGSRRMDGFTDPDDLRASQLPTFGSISSMSAQGSTDMKFRDEVIPPNTELELGKSISLLYQKLDEEKVRNSVEFDLFRESLELSGPELKVIEDGVEVSTEDPVNRERSDSQRFDSSLVEIIDIADIFKEDEAFDVDVERMAKLDKEPDVKELDSDSYDVMTSRSTDLDLSVDYQKFSYSSNLAKSVSLVDIAEVIENDFLNMLSFEQRPANMVSDSGLESYGNCLLREFEEDIKALEHPYVDGTELLDDQELCSLVPHSYKGLESFDEFDFSFGIQAVRSNHVGPIQTSRTGRNAKMLEYQETELLMQEWGLNEMAFRSSPHGSPAGFGSPVYPSDEQPLKLPSLGEGLGSMIHTRDGGLLRSMNPLLFQNAINGAKLVVQVSSPIVIPAAMGFTTMEILQHWASGGVEKTSLRLKELMPLEDITGKTVQQVASETKSGPDASRRRGTLHALEIGLESIGEKDAYDENPEFTSEKIEPEYVSLENLVPLAIKNIEGLLIEGLKIQSDVQCKESPSSIWIDFSEISGFLEYSVSLEEWIRLDSGDFDASAITDENVGKVLAAHCAKKADDKFDSLGRKCGVFRNKFTMALKVQLRDPLRDYEMVGSAMLALVQVERIYSLGRSSSRDGDDLDQTVIEEGIGNGIPRFKVLDVRLAGLNLSSAHKHVWGTSRQHQLGTRWLFSSGIARTNKHSISHTYAIVKNSSMIMKKAWEEDVFWSISPPSQGEAVPWDEVVALNIHVRNPDIIFPNGQKCLGR